MARTAPITPYVPHPAPLLDGGDSRYLQNELASLKLTLADLTLLTPQPAIVAPNIVKDGMTRLARSPWRPLGGVVDLWVYWDAPSVTWKAL